MRPTAQAALRGLATLACVVGVGVADVGAAPRGPDVPLAGRYQDAPDPPGPGDGEASVTVEIGPRSTVNTITLDGSGATETAFAANGAADDITTRRSAAPSDAMDGVVAALATEHTVSSPAASQPVAVEVPADDGVVSATIAAPAVHEQVSDGLTIDGIATGGQTGVRVQIGDTMGGAGEPGAPGGDAHVVVRTGPITGGLAVAGEATGGDGIDLLAGETAGLTDGLVDDEGSARLGSLIGLTDDDGRLGPARGGTAIGGPAQGGDATVDIVIGDTIGGAGANGQAGGDAGVLIEIGPITGGRAAGGAATGGDAIQGTGSARGGSATGGTARGGDARVVIAVGDTVGLSGRGAAGDAAVLIAIGSVTGGDAAGGAASGGTAWGPAGIDAGGGDATGGIAEGGAAIVALEIDQAPGGRYEANVGAIVGGDATGGAAVGGDAIDVEIVD